MSLLDLFKLVGFTTGTALHLYLFWLYLRQRDAERTPLPWLALTVGTWHLGNLLDLLLGSPGIVGHDSLRRAVDTLAFGALAFLPPLTLQNLFFVLRTTVATRMSSSYFKFRIAVCYLPVLILPFPLSLIWKGDYSPAMVKLDRFLVLFIVWLSAVLLECGLTAAFIRSRINRTGDRRFFGLLSATLLLMSGLFVFTYLGDGQHISIIGGYLETAARLSSILPTFLIAYYIYRYNYLGLVIRQSFVYAVFSLAIMIAYLYGIRSGAAFLEHLLGLNARLIETVLVLGLIFLAAPLRRITEDNVRKLFASEIASFRKLIAEIDERSSTVTSRTAYFDYIEQALRNGLDLPDLKVTSSDMDIATSSVETRFPIICHGISEGVISIPSAKEPLSDEKHRVLETVVGHLASGLERVILQEENSKLQRELEAKERLAEMGRMAASIAHEVRNPLSSIKTMAQVMREDPVVSGEYSTELDLINREVDRLSRSVNQLLSFARPGAVSDSPKLLSAIVEETRTACAGVLSESGAQVTANLQVDPLCSGITASCLRDALTNLVSNAAQSSAKVILIMSSNPFNIMVEDDGPGIPEELKGKIFAPFFTTRLRGTGLGLSIVTKRVAEINGTLSLESPLSELGGCRFRISLKSDLLPK